MAMIPVTYLSGATLSNTLGMFKRGTIAQNLKTLLESGYKWWSGIDIQSNQYLIYSDTYTMGTTTQANATPVAWSTPDLTDTSLLNLINTLPPRIGKTPFTSLPIALQWLQSSNQFFLIRTGTENIVKSGLQLYVDAGRYNSYSGTGTNWVDLSGEGNNSTLINGTIYNSSGVASMYFDGTDDYVESINNLDLSGTNPRTYSVWVKIKTYLDNSGIIRTGTQGTASADMSLETTTTPGTFTFNGWVTDFDFTVDSNFYGWHNLVIVYDGTKGLAYADGIFKNSLTFTSVAPNSKLQLGSDRKEGAVQGNNLDGFISNAMVYNRALSDTEILQNFNTQKYRFGYYDVFQSGVTLNLDATNYLSYPRSGNTWNDLSGNNINGSLENSPTFSGGSSPSIVFDGSDDYVNLGTTLNSYIRNNLPFTLETVVYLKTSNNNEFFISNSWDDPGIHIRKRGSTHAPADGIRFLFIQDGGNGRGKDSLPLNTGWYHLVGTYNGEGIESPSNYQLYVNASTGGTSDVVFGTPTNPIPTNAMNIGRSGDATNYGYLNGAVGVANFYNIALTPQQVYQNYYKFSNLYPITGITTNGLVLNLDAGNYASYGGVGTVWKDISGNAYDGILTNGPTYSGSGLSSSIVFDGADDYVINSNFNITPINNELCISLWYRTSNNANEKMLIDLCGITNTSSNRDFFSIRQNWNSNNKISCYFNSTAGFQYVSFPNQVVTNTWNNIVYSKVGNTLNAYLNGVSVATQNVSGNIQTIQRYIIAQDNLFSSNLFSGSIANVMIYNRGLSAFEVLQNYNAQKSRFGL